ncbi:hypothetical protein [Celeribacter persicus]|uniref:hypothetical protein n=1 Tax=Celeribacter persicus TaxID=1651082 RepID=UPI0014742A98|nr:hypothetical protein [Celeribacter persicus]
MIITIEALDSQFAAATGSNVNSGSGTSQFDHPPTSTNALIIESQPGALAVGKPRIDRL